MTVAAINPLVDVIAGDAPDALMHTYKRAPVEFVGGEGVYLIDRDGKRYLDFVSGIAVNALGYGDAGLKRALHAAAEGLIHTSNLYRTAPGEELAQRSSRSRSRTRCSSATRARRPTRARSSSRVAGRASAARRSTRSSRCAARFTDGCSARSPRPTGPAYRLPFRPLAGGISIFERDIEDLSLVAQRRDDGRR